MPKEPIIKDPETIPLDPTRFRFTRLYGAWDVEDVATVEEVSASFYAQCCQEIREQVDVIASLQRELKLVDIAWVDAGVKSGSAVATDFMEEHGRLPNRDFDPDKHYLAFAAVATFLVGASSDRRS